ncbi:hypothetical protein BpHYR1_048586 [Brachionus plicatilis]|uniref:Uncharacterized protein n=1 Tax=Brachionus plicatilis TaxID=10195 RepID=A0A3M7PP51_BRAPC|nr:hypothetical protein BpHYR1_048586 [Brachionus plicatilis]
MNILSQYILKLSCKKAQQNINKALQKITCYIYSYSSESISSADNEEDSNRSNLRIENSDLTSLARTISSPDNSYSNIPCTSTSILTQSPKLLKLTFKFLALIVPSNKINILLLKKSSFLA